MDSMFTSPQISSVKLLTPDCQVEPLGGGQVMRMGAALSKRPAELACFLSSVRECKKSAICNQETSLDSNHAGTLDWVSSLQNCRKSFLVVAIVETCMSPKGSCVKEVLFAWCLGIWCATTGRWKNLEDVLPCMRFQIAGDTSSKGIERFQPSSSISHTT